MALYTVLTTEMYDTKSIIIALGFTLISGLSTGIGSLLALFAKKTNTRFLAVSLGFSAGVMIYVSFIEIFFKANNTLVTNLGNKTGSWITVLSFFGGMLYIALIDRIIPNRKNPHELLRMESPNKNSMDESIGNNRLMRMGIFTAIAIAIHNFPEGIATFLSALTNPTLAVGVTVAIALHNIPEGISVFIPIYYATGNRKKAFIYSFLSGLSEPIGAVIGFLIFMPFLSETLFGILFAGVAGIMVFISLDELLPAAREYGETHLSIYGLIFGMALMAFSLLLLL
ncbi:MAG: zinc transporter ZupT [Bacilli bacterium]|nr:zinc transporter ZupT [Bacilli bacterium]MDD4077283.1 zinc transporter ZupT [Bacilli bacterium]MDD4387959.1 zinc transporter ZupT [Bacilli bacterium]